MVDKLAVSEVSQPQHNSEDIVTVVCIKPHTHEVYGEFRQGEPRYMVAKNAQELVEIEDDSGNALFREL